MRSALLLAVLSLVPLSAAVSGWRGDGSGVYADAYPPTTWNLEKNEQVAWSIELPGSGAAAPVALDGVVHVLAEPDLLLAIDLATGAERWRAEVGFGGAEAAQDAAAREQIKLALAADSKSRKPFYEAAAKAVGLKKIDRPELGYLTAAPLADGERVYVCTGLGLVAAFDPSGTRSWRVASPGNKSGSWNASPLLVEGHLVLAGGSTAMVGLDPATGAVRWSAPWLSPSRRVGTPARWQAGGSTFLIASDGTVVRAKDGAVVSTGGSASGTEASPVVAGDRVFLTRGDDHSHGEQYVEACDLRLDGGQVVLSPAWRTPDRKTLKGTFTRVTPLILGDRLLSIVPGKAALWVEQIADGSPWAPQVAVAVPAAHHMWRPEPILAGGHLYVPTNEGVIHVVKIDAEPWTLVHRAELGAPMTAAPVASGNRLLLRTATRLICLERGR